MPYLKIETGSKVEQKEELLTEASHLVASKLGKPESYVMVALEGDVAMVFGGEKKDAVFMQLKSIGLQETQTEELSSALCNFVQEKLGIDSSRVYIEFTDAPGSMWGWKGSTF